MIIYDLLIRFILSIAAIFEIKCYILYWIISINFSISFISINLWSNFNLHCSLIINNKFYPLSWFIKMIAQYFNLHYSLYISFLTFSYINILGFLLFIVFLLQLSSGILLSIYYNDFFTIAFDSLAFIIINVNNGWFIRILHVIGASLFICLFYSSLFSSPFHSYYFE